jgi:hypothetical protein
MAIRNSADTPVPTRLPTSLNDANFDCSVVRDRDRRRRQDDKVEWPSEKNNPTEIGRF